MNAVCRGLLLPGTLACQALPFAKSARRQTTETTLNMGDAAARHDLGSMLSSRTPTSAGWKLRCNYHDALHKRACQL
jgi:hypothetical protein